jgi:hypothetical protein
MDDERNAPDTHAAAETTRRRLLRAATGGFALAACGLYVPGLGGGADAREGVLGGELGGRHGKDRRGRHRRRTHRDQKDQKDDKNKGKDDRPPGAGAKDHGPFRATALTVVNKISQPLNCTFYYRVKTGLDDYALPTAGVDRTIGPNESFRYDPDRYRVGVHIKQTPGWQDVYADVRNVSFWFPRGGVTEGQDLDPHTGKVGSPLIDEQNFVVGEAHGRAGFVLRRKGDSADRIEWEFVVGEPS